MLLVNHIPQSDPHQVYVQARSAPRCYARAKARATTQPRGEFDAGVVLFLSVMIAVAAFWLAYSAWRL